MRDAGFTYIPPLTTEAQDRAFEANEKLTIEERKAFDEALNAFSTESPDDGCFVTSQRDIFPGQALRDELVSAGDLVAKCIEHGSTVSECARYEQLIPANLALGSDEFLRVSEIVVVDQDRGSVNRLREVIETAFSTGEKSAQEAESDQFAQLAALQEREVVAATASLDCGLIEGRQLLEGTIARLAERGG